MVLSGTRQEYDKGFSDDTWSQLYGIILTSNYRKWVCGVSLVLVYTLSMKTLYKMCLQNVDGYWSYTMLKWHA